MLESLAYVLILGVIAAAWLASFLLDKLFGVGFHPLLSTVIGSVVGIVILLVKPTLGVVAMIAAAVVAIVSSIVQDKIL
ncbi:MAG: hypothetical protein IJK63_09405 [Oscillospiraceae bacterium]|nr:hypothetical protein [Oscillospiraceae bacterium]